MADRLAITLHAFGPESAEGQGPTCDIGAHRSAAVLTLRAVGVIGTLTVTVETSPDEAAWRSVGTLTPIAAPSGVDEGHAFDRLERYVRVSWPDGTNAGFSVEGEAHQLFATRTALKTALPADTLAAAADDVIASALIQASADVENALGTVHDLPITQWSPAVTQRAAAIAAYHIAMQRGFAGGGIDELLVLGLKDARDWLKGVAKRELTVAGVAPEPDAAAQASSGIPDRSGDFSRRFTDDWGDF